LIPPAVLIIGQQGAKRILMLSDSSSKNLVFLHTPLVFNPPDSPFFLLLQS